MTREQSNKLKAMKAWANLPAWRQETNLDVIIREAKHFLWITAVVIIFVSL